MSRALFYVFHSHQQVETLQFIHLQGYVHRNIRPETIIEGGEGVGTNRNDASFRGNAYLFGRFFE